MINIAHHGSFALSNKTNNSKNKNHGINNESFWPRKWNLWM
jgi:hypothetical protein